MASDTIMSIIASVCIILWQAFEKPTGQAGLFGKSQQHVLNTREIVVKMRPVFLLPVIPHEPIIARIRLIYHKKVSRLDALFGSFSFLFFSTHHGMRPFSGSVANTPPRRKDVN